MPNLNQNIAVLGLGLEGVSLINWIHKHFKKAQITVFDQKNRHQLKPFISQINYPQKIRFSLGKKYLKKGFKNYQVIFRSPGFYRLSSPLLKAEKNLKLITSPTQLFFDNCPAKIIGVTGTKGKGTTTTLIYQILKKQKRPGSKVYLAGNIGKPMLDILDDLKSEDIVCLELSSFQLQDLTKSPHLAVVLNITSEHLDVHQNTKEYQIAKRNILKYQSKNDFCFLNADYPITRQLKKFTKAKIYWFSKKKLIINPHQVKLIGEHNLENIAAACKVAIVLNIPLKTIQKAVYQFKGLEHRLELVKSVNQITFYNDSFSTTPETAIAAIKSFKKPVIIILGGSDKGSDYSKLGQTIAKSQHIKAVILIGKMAGKIKKSIPKSAQNRVQLVQGASSMTQIVNQAYHLAEPGQVILLSPSCASFDMFKNYKDRGDQFKKAVKALK